MAFPAEVARFLLVEPQEVRRMVGMDRLPAVEIPLRKRKVLRIYLPDLHRWLVARSPDSMALRNYPEFLERFDEIARSGREKVSVSSEQ
jgi:hypothetical protein